MMDAYAKADMLKEAHETFDKMIAQGMKPGNDVMIEKICLQCSAVV
jgi:pentatricopeptide repeat protein